jgi:hypothetical protein
MCLVQLVRCRLGVGQRWRLLLEPDLGRLGLRYFDIPNRRLADTGIDRLRLMGLSIAAVENGLREFLQTRLG